MIDVVMDMTPLAGLSSLRGIGSVVRSLARNLMALSDEERKGLSFAWLVSQDKMASYKIVDSLEEALVPPREMPTKKQDMDRMMGARFKFAPLVRKRGGRLLHITEPQGHPLDPRVTTVVTCYDLIPILMAKDYLPPVPLVREVLLAREWARYKRAAHAIAISEATKRDVVEHLGISPDRIDVIHLGVDHDRFHPRADAGERDAVSAVIGTTAPYVLYLGAGDARKDLETLVRAFAVARETRDMHLVIGGNLRARKDVLLAAAREAGVLDRLQLPGYVPEDVVAALYRQAALHVFPSRYEGFGFPVVEALACGTPTITSPGSSLDEVAGDAALIVECGNVEGLASLMDKILSSTTLQADLRARGIERAKLFNWRTNALRTVEVYQRVLSSK